MKKREELTHNEGTSSNKVLTIISKSSVIFSTFNTNEYSVPNFTGQFITLEKNTRFFLSN